MFIFLNYIKKPRLFISDIDQLSDFQVTDELIDYAVSDLLLQLKDNSFQYVKQLNGQN